MVRPASKGLTLEGDRAGKDSLLRRSESTSKNVEMVLMRELPVQLSEKG